MISLFAALFGLAAAAASGCVQKNASHCANLDGDATCASRGAGSCSKCTSVNDGCVGTVEPECAVGVTGSETTGSTTATPATETTSSSSTAGSSSSTSTPTDESTSAASTTGPVPYCGDGNIDLEMGENCDGSMSLVASCEELGYIGGELGCTAECELDTSQCMGQIACGNGTIEEGEECDGTDFNGETCATQRMSENFGGDLHCDNGTCTIDDSLCCKINGVGCLANPECCSNKCRLMGLNLTVCVP